MRDSAGKSSARARAVLHDQAAWQRPRPLNLPIGPLGSRWYAHNSERARQRDARPRCCSRGVVTTTPGMVMSPARILVVDDEPGMVRAIERVLSDDHRVREPR